MRAHARSLACATSMLARSNAMRVPARSLCGLLAFFLCRQMHVHARWLARSLCGTRRHGPSLSQPGPLWQLKDSDVDSDGRPSSSESMSAVRRTANVRALSGRAGARAAGTVCALAGERTAHTGRGTVRSQAQAQSTSETRTRKHAADFGGPPSRLVYAWDASTLGFDSPKAQDGTQRSWETGREPQMNCSADLQYKYRLFDRQNEADFEN